VPRTPFPPAPEGSRRFARSGSALDDDLARPRPSAAAGSQAGRARAAGDARLIKRYKRSGDLRVREALLKRFMPLAESLARRFRGTGEPIADLNQVAAIGLLNAIDRFEPARGTSLTSFAVPTILGELKRHLRDRGWVMRVPRALHDQAIKVERGHGDLARALGRSPSAAELAQHTSLSVEQVLEARDAIGARRPVSLDKPRTDDGEAGDTVGDFVGVEEQGFKHVEDASTTERLMAGLDDRCREILRLRFEEDLKQWQIGERIGVSQMHVSRLIRQSLERMQAEAPSAP